MNSQAENYLSSETVSSEELTLKDLILATKEWSLYVFSYWLYFIFFVFIGGAIGLTYSWFQPTNYTSKITFLVEESKSGGAAGALGGLASIAGQFGVDVGGSSSGGVLAGENILFYFKSVSLAREVLLSKYADSSTKSFADVYAEVYEKNEEWEGNPKIGKISFPPLSPKVEYSRLQDSLIQSMADEIIKTQFVITKTDKKAAFIEVSTVMRNEQLSNLYNNRIVKIAIDKYIEIKTQRQKSTVDKLQIRADSIAGLLTNKTISGANLQSTSSTMDINPLYRAGTAVAVETTLRDKTLLATIFASVTQNLELAKFTLSQETPVIQVVDQTRFPLKKVKVRKLTSSIYGGLITGFIFLFWIVGKRSYRIIMK